MASRFWSDLNIKLSKADQNRNCSRVTRCTAFETKAKRSTGLNDAFVPVPKAKPAEIAPPPPPPEPIVIPNIVGGAVAAIEAEAAKPIEGPQGDDKIVYPEHPVTVEIEVPFSIDSL